MLELLHSGHPGRIWMQHKYKESYFWPGGGERVADSVHNCRACSLAGKNSQSKPVKTTAVPPPDRPWKKLLINITGPFWTVPKHQWFIVVLTDYFSKYPEILFTANTGLPQIIEWLKTVFGHFRLLDELVSDNGPQFMSNMFTSFLAANNIKHNRCAVYNPQQNGLVEILNRSFKKGAEVISCDPTGESPYKLLLGYSPCTITDVRNPILFRSGGEDQDKSRKQNRPSHLSLEQKNQIVQTNSQNIDMDVTILVLVLLTKVLLSQNQFLSIHTELSLHYKTLSLQNVLNAKSWNVNLHDPDLWELWKSLENGPINWKMAQYGMLRN